MLASYLGYLVYYFALRGEPGARIPRARDWLLRLGDAAFPTSTG